MSEVSLFIPTNLPRQCAFVLALLLVSTSLFFHVLPLRAEERQDFARAQYVSPATVKEWLEQGKPVVFLDVREPDEFVAGHLPGAINIVYDQVASLADKLPHDQPIVLYCIHSAHRAPEAAKTLRTLGFDNAYVLEGGIVAWHAGGLTILASNPQRQPTILPKTERCAEANQSAISP